MPDHIHMLVSIPPNEKASSFMEYLKWKSTMTIFERYAKLKYKYGLDISGVEGITLVRWVATSKPCSGIYRIKRKKI